MIADKLLVYIVFKINKIKLIFVSGTMLRGDTGEEQS